MVCRVEADNERRASASRDDFAFLQIMSVAYRPSTSESACFVAVSNQSSISSSIKCTNTSESVSEVKYGLFQELLLSARRSFRKFPERGRRSRCSLKCGCAFSVTPPCVASVSGRWRFARASSSSPSAICASDFSNCVNDDVAGCLYAMPHESYPRYSSFQTLTTISVAFFFGPNIQKFHT